MPHVQRAGLDALAQEVVAPRHVLDLAEGGRVVGQRDCSLAIDGKCQPANVEGSGAAKQLACSAKDGYIAKQPACCIINNDGWRSETLIYDGIPVYDRNGLSLEPSLRRAEDYVFQQTGIHIELAEKPMFNENLTVHNVLSHISNR